MPREPCNDFFGLSGFCPQCKLGIFGFDAASRRRRKKATDLLPIMADAEMLRSSKEST